MLQLDAVFPSRGPMTLAKTLPPADSALLLQPPIVAALIALVGVFVGLFVREVVLGLYLNRKARDEALADRQADRTRAHRDLVRLYADPLLDAARSLRFRLDEIVDRQQGR